MFFCQHGQNLDCTPDNGILLCAFIVKTVFQCIQKDFFHVFVSIGCKIRRKDVMQCKLDLWLFKTLEFFFWQAGQPSVKASFDLITCCFPGLDSQLFVFTTKYITCDCFDIIVRDACTYGNIPTSMHVYGVIATLLRIFIFSEEYHSKHPCLH